MVRNCQWNALSILSYKSRNPEVFLGKGVLKTCSKFTGRHQAEV